MTSSAAELAVAKVLEAHGLDRPADEAAAILAGIAAAPASPEGFPGLRLLGQLPEAARAELSRLAANAADRYKAELEETAPGRHGERLSALRGELKRRGLDGFIVPLNDEYNGEYVPRRAQRLAWLTGFSGSAGLAIVLGERAGVFTDGRYSLQVKEQVDAAHFTTHHITEEPPFDWLAAALKPGQRFAYDPWLHTVDGVARLKAACEKAGASLVAVESNPLDAIWPGQPPAPLSPVSAQPLEFAGESAEAKRERMAGTLREAGAAAVVLTLPESIAWLLNLRGADVPHTPLPLGFAILKQDGAVDLFIDRRKLLPETLSHLGNGVALHELASFGPALGALGAAGQVVQADPASAPSWVFDRLQEAGAKLLRAEDPCLLPKACKNAVELEGSRRAHLRDGRAVVRFLAWLAREAPGGGLDEITAAAKLASFRRENELFRDLSFSTISGAGPNGAIVHYRVTGKSNRKLEPGSLYLVDSGGQYLDATTDITRTLAIGRPTAEMRDRFTRVLKGHIALASTIFPVGTTGSHLDVLARHALWQAGLDYDHGTGHGVGAYLSVHEGPHRISKAANNVALRPGMIVSNEPGYYKTGAYGIRIENLVAVQEVETPAGGERKMLGFETLTRAPIDLALVEPALMSAEEIAWLDRYHANVRQSLSPLLDQETRTWLAEATRPLGG